MIGEGFGSRDEDVAGLQMVANVGNHADFELAAIDLSRVGGMSEQITPAFARKAQGHGADRNPIGAPVGPLAQHVPSLN